MKNIINKHTIKFCHNQSQNDESTVVHTLNTQLVVFFSSSFLRAPNKCAYLHAFCIIKLVEADLEELWLYISLSTSIHRGAVEILQKPSFHFHGCIYMLSFFELYRGALSPDIKQR